MSMAGGFQHPALDQAAEQLRKLQQAAAMVGSPDPIAALRYIDCSPDVLRQFAAGVEHSGVTLTQARQRLQVGRQTADQDWRGSAADSFNQSADSVDQDHGQAVDATRTTAQAGKAAADGLDNLARDAANQAIAIAVDADPACDDVINQNFNPAAQVKVNLACTNVVTMVQRHVAQIPSVTSDLTTTTNRAVGQAAGLGASGSPHAR